MRGSTLLMATFLMACGPARPSIAPDPEPPARVQATSTGVNVWLDSDERVVGDVVPLSADSAWNAVVALYDQLGFPIEVHDATGRVIATGFFRAPREILDQPLGNYMDCGHTLTGPRVSMWRVTARLMTQVESLNDGTAVRSRLTASAQPRDGSSTRAVPCTSKGQLEGEIVRRVREGVGGGG